MMQNRQDSCFAIAKYMALQRDREKADPGKDSPIMHIPLKITQVMKPTIVLFFTQHTVSNNNKKGQWHQYALKRQTCKHYGKFKTAPKIWGCGEKSGTGEVNWWKCLCSKIPHKLLRDHTLKIISQHDSSKRHQRKQHQHNMTTAKSPKFTFPTFSCGSSEHLKLQY